MSKLCIYHGNCADGFGAAWVVRKALGEDVDFHAGVYQNAPPDVSGRDVILVDFSYKRPVLEDMARSAKTITILDHHKSAADDLVHFANPPNMAESFEQFADLAEFHGFYPIRALFDMERSGAMLAWNYFFPRIAPPKLIEHIQDRDLWRFALPKTREIQANVFSYPYDFAVWDKLIGSDMETLAAEGEAIERKHFKDIAELVKVCRREITIGGIVVPAASLPYTLTSDAGHLMATEHASKIGVCYWDTPDGRVFSLRSTDDGPDVSEIAKQYGGGGHAHASGFRVPYGHELT